MREVEEYVAAFANMTVRQERQVDAQRIAAKIAANHSRYAIVEAATGVPWWWIGIVHSLEAGLNFNAHLHNGDPLNTRTHHVPAGRPVTGEPPFSWEESARDALVMKNYHRGLDWNIGPSLERLEGYNGGGYRSKGVPSPYVWSFSTIYESGKYIADHQYDPNAVSAQCGGAVLLHCLIAAGEITFADCQPGTTPPAMTFAIPAADGPGEIVYAIGSPVSEAVRAIQRRLNELGYADKTITIDGVYGVRTRSAVLDFQAENGLVPHDGIVGPITWETLMDAGAKAWPPPAIADKGIVGARADGHPEVVAADGDKTLAKVAIVGAAAETAKNAGLLDLLSQTGKDADTLSHALNSLVGIAKFGLDIVLPAALAFAAFVLWRRYGARISALVDKWSRPT
jgi:lysozyme family protein/peptidoglycan hydrolase-like protein with peptidoglycan-binding domain